MSILAFSNVAKAFGAITALSGISFSIKHGKAIGLVDGNRAGESTLAKTTAGNFPAHLRHHEPRRSGCLFPSAVLRIL